VEWEKPEVLALPNAKLVAWRGSAGRLALPGHFSRVLLLLGRCPEFESEDYTH